MDEEEELEIHLSDDDDDDDAPEVRERASSSEEQAPLAPGFDAPAAAADDEAGGAAADDEAGGAAAGAAGDDPMDSDALEIDLSESEEPRADELQHPGSSSSRPGDREAGGGTSGQAGQAPLPHIPRKGGLIPRKGDVHAGRLVQGDVLVIGEGRLSPAAKPSLPASAAEAKAGDKRVLLRSDMDEVSTHYKKGKKAAEGAAGVEMRNLAKVKMQEMTPEEMQASISFPPPPRGLGPKRLLIHMQHPRVLEPPHKADLSLYLHAQLDALLGGGTKFLFTDRCCGFMAFFANLSCLFTGREAGGVSVAKLGRYLTCDRELNAKVLELITRLLFAEQVEAHVASEGGGGGGGADRTGGGRGEGGAGVAGETDGTREAMAGNLWHSLQLLHNYLEFETQFAGEAQYQMMTTLVVAHPQLLSIFRRSLDMLEARCLRGPWGNYLKDIMAQAAAPAVKVGKGKGGVGGFAWNDGAKLSRDCKPRLFVKVVELWLDVQVRWARGTTQMRRKANISTHTHTHTQPPKLCTLSSRTRA